MFSIRRRLVLSLFAGSAALVLATGLGFALLASRELRGQYDEALLTVASALVILTEEEGGVIEVEYAQPFIPGFESQAAPDYFEVWPATGSLVQRSRSLAGRDLPRFPEPSAKPRFRNLRLPDGRAGRMVEMTFVPRFEATSGSPVAGQPPGLTPVTLVVARSRENLEELILVLYGASIAMAVTLLTGLVLLARYAVERGLAPLDDIGRQIDSLGADRLDAGIRIDPPVRELVPIVEGLDTLLARLRAAFERERHLSSEMAHELRTPIAELRTLAEVGGRWPEGREAVLTFFRDVEAISGQMEKIVATLLSLARCESGVEGVELIAVDLDDLVATAWSPFARPAGERGLSFSATSSGGARILGDPVKLSLILANLFANAVAYSPAGSAIRCTVGLTSGDAEIAVANLAPQLSPEDLPFLYERFWRKDPSRGDTRHAGLGLTLARALAELQGLRLAADLEPGNRLVFRLAGLRRPSPGARVSTVASDRPAAGEAAAAGSGAHSL